MFVFSANNKTQDVASFLNDVGRPCLLTARDWKMMDPGPSTRIPYSKDEIKALRAACDTEDERDVIEFYAGLGLLKGEGYQTKWTDVDFTNRYIRVGVSYQTKQGPAQRANGSGVDRTAESAAETAPGYGLRVPEH